MLLPKERANPNNPPEDQQNPSNIYTNNNMVDISKIYTKDLRDTLLNSPGLLELSRIAD